MWGAELVFQPTCFYSPGNIGYTDKKEKKIFPHI
jgi:hypothetical protein